MKRSEMSPTDVLTAQCYVSDPHQLSFFDKIDQAVDIQCKRQFKRSPDPIIKDGLIKFKVPPDVKVCDPNKAPLTLGDLKAGQRIIPILKASCLWSGGGSVGVSLKAVRIMVTQEEHIDEEDVDFAF